MKPVQIRKRIQTWIKALKKPVAPVLRENPQTRPFDFKAYKEEIMQKHLYRWPGPF